MNSWQWLNYEAQHLSSSFKAIYSDVVTVKGTGSEEKTMSKGPGASLTSNPYFIFINVLSGLVAVVGNSLVLITLYRTSRLHTMSNIFLASLAASDFVVGAVGNPLNIIREANAFAWIYLQLVPALNISALTVDRYTAISRPLRYAQLVTKTTALVAIAFIWVSPVLVCLPTVLTGDSYYRQIIVILSFFFPFVVIIVCYTEITRASHRQLSRISATTPAPLSSGSTPNSIRNDKKAAKTFALITVVFLLSFAPHMAGNIIIIVEGKPKYMGWLDVFMFLSSALNPIIYASRNASFRRAFMQLFCRRCLTVANNLGQTKAKEDPT
ncbi:dopamine receptor 3-like [Nematostella vectensis]|uniref:dopamine receptor 3-like n=1 Tax=Nematostella vectensis TaxID=45351 RepID=UPI0020777FED|nr:dopamine receptor 3-like [Nematostella vectensis]